MRCAACMVREQGILSWLLCCAVVVQVGSAGFPWLLTHGDTAALNAVRIRAMYFKYPKYRPMSRQAAVP